MTDDGVDRGPDEREPARTRHVLLVGWDGVRDDERRAARTPHLDALAAAGFGVPVRVHPGNPTISGPVWTTVATGVRSGRHGVHDNDLSSYRREEHPDLLARVRAAIPGATTSAAAAWGPLVTTEDGGPLFAGGGHHPVRPEDTWEGLEAADADAVAHTVRALATQDHAALFCYLELPDTVGHVEGVTPRYRAAVETCDTHLGALLAAVEARPRRADEDWLVVVTTDHGHRDDGGHGGDSDEERSAWIVAAGPGVDAGSGAGVDHADIPVTALAFLGVPVGDEREGAVFAAERPPSSDGG